MTLPSSRRRGSEGRLGHTNRGRRRDISCTFEHFLQNLLVFGEILEFPRNFVRFEDLFSLLFVIVVRVELDVFKQINKARIDNAWLSRLGAYRRRCVNLKNAFNWLLVLRIF